MGGASTTPSGVLFLRNGTVAGYSDAGAGGGTFGASAMVVITKYYYVGGDPSILGAKDFGGNRTQINLSGGEALCASLGIVVMNGPNNQGFIFGVAFAAGVGASFPPVGFNINGGTTIIWK